MVHGNQMKVMLPNDMEKLERTLFRLEQGHAVTGFSTGGTATVLFALGCPMLVCTYISLLYVMRIVECYSSGRVTPSCTDMTPRHRDFSAQQTASPYLVISDQTSYKGGDEITVTLKADSTPFRGFMLQAHEVGGSDPVGSFTVTDVQAQILSCNGMPGAHPVLGCLIMILAFIQPLAAVFRCGPDHSWRFIFNWAHALNAVAIKFLAVAAIFTGLSIIDRTSDMWVLKVMGGFVGWEALLYLLQELHFRLSQKDAVEGIPQLMKMEVILLILFSVGNLPFLVAVLIGIGMS